MGGLLMSRWWMQVATFIAFSIAVYYQFRMVRGQGTSGLEYAIPIMVWSWLCWIFYAVLMVRLLYHLCEPPLDMPYVLVANGLYLLGGISMAMSCKLRHDMERQDGYQLDRTTLESHL